MATAPTKETKELRRWCVDAAMRWPMVNGLNNNYQALGAVAQYNQVYSQSSEANIISRAKKIEAYVLGRAT